MSFIRLLTKLAMSNIWANPDRARRYMEDLLEEKKLLSFYVHGLPRCNLLLNQEIRRVSQIVSDEDLNIFNGLQFGNLNLSSPSNFMPDFAAIDLARLDGNSGWNLFRHERFSGPQGPPTQHWNALAARRGNLLTKKILRLDVPVDRYPNYNFVGRLLGPRGNSIKRIEAVTGCRIFIKGRGSMKDSNKEERLRRLGCRHLNEPLHVLIEAEAPVNEVDARLQHAQEIVLDVLQPVNYSRDFYKREQLRELAILNSPLNGNYSQPSSSASPCKSGAITIRG